MSTTDFYPYEIAKSPDKVLKLLRATAFDHISHRFERTVLCLRKTAQVALRHRRIVPRAGTKEPAVTANESAECIGDSIHQRYGQPSSEHTVT